MPRTKLRRRRREEQDVDNENRSVTQNDLETSIVAPVARAAGHDIRRVAGSQATVAHAAGLIQRDPPADASAPTAAVNPQSSMLHAMFQGGVVAPIKNTHAMLAKPKPDLHGASTQIDAATTTLGPMIDAARAVNNEEQALRIVDLSNILSGYWRIIQEHAGHPFPISQVAENVDPDAGNAVQSRIQGIEAALDAPMAATKSAADRNLNIANRHAKTDQ